MHEHDLAHVALATQAVPDVTGSAGNAVGEFERGSTCFHKALRASASNQPLLVVSIFIPSPRCSRGGFIASPASRLSRKPSYAKCYIALAS